jgi:signal peptidase II
VFLLSENCKLKDTIDMPLLILAASTAFILSFSAKLVADAYLHERIAILGSFAGLLPTRNPGIAFGLQLPGGFQEILIVLALILVLIAAVRSDRSRIGDWGYGLIVGGALGNVVDRIRDGFVTDFFQVGTFPVFNVADSCITVGVVLLLAQSLISVRGNRSKR